MTSGHHHFISASYFLSLFLSIQVVSPLNLLFLPITNGVNLIHKFEIIRYSLLTVEDTGGPNELIKIEWNLPNPSIVWRCKQKFKKIAVNSLNALSVGVEPCVEPQDGNGYPKFEYPTSFTR